MGWSTSTGGFQQNLQVMPLRALTPGILMYLSVFFLQTKKDREEKMMEKRIERKRKLKEAFDKNYDTDRIGNAVNTRCHIVQ